MSQSRHSDASATSDHQSNYSDSARHRTAKHSKRRFRQRTPFARERDVFRQLQPWEETFKPTTLYRYPWPDVPSSDPPVPAQPCPDTALSAFAQLCALRLHARRCLVSLTCKDREYVLSEMTKTTSLQYDYFEDPQDAPCFGTCSMPRSASINDKAFDQWHEARGVRKIPADTDHYYTEGISPHYHIVSDLRHNAQYHDLGVIKHATWARFCLSVPLRGGHGSVIGSITVFDDKPRYGVHVGQMKLMEDISDTIVQHLESIRIGVQRLRGERMLQAIKIFNSGKESLRGWWQAADDAHSLAMGRDVDPGSAHDRQLRENVQFGEQSTNTPHRYDYGAGNSEQAKRHANTGTEPPKAEAPRPTQAHKAENRKLSGRRTHEKFGLEDGFNLAAASMQAYHRGANLLREALGLDGVLIVNTAISGKQASSDVSERSSESTQDGETSESGPDGVRLCEVFASSIRKRPGAGNATSDDDKFHMSMAALKRLMKRYPDGSLFHIDTDGTAYVSSSDVQSATDTNQDDAPRDRPNKDGRFVQRSLKDARSVAFYPIWDDSLDRHRACVFAYSLQEEQSRDKSEDLAYLSTFGHSISATLSHFESVAADTAKGSFISSISHELRSPLHGVMAGVEFLQESELTADQYDMCSTISAAGTILLDTVNHILDYSKISNHVRAERRGDKVADVTRSSKDADDVALVSSLDLAQLTEDVAETTVVSYRAQHRPYAASSRQWPEESSQAFTPAQDVSVVLDIEQRPHWHVEIQSGGWTRIIMNILTNALKYTKQGRIGISLRTEDPGEAHDDNDVVMRRVLLSIEDTGMGMSEDFVRHGAWLPFKQVDPHSTGTGLGLSIVSEIAKGMGAQVELHSRLDKGTRVEVSFMGRFTAQKTLLPPTPAIKQLEVLSAASRTELPVDDIELTSAEWSVDASVRKTAEDWLQAAVVSRTSATGIGRKAICVITESDLEDWRMRKPDDLATVFNHLASEHAHLLILAKAVHSTPPTEDFIQAIKPIFLQHPIGPRKLMRAISGDGRCGMSKRGSPAEGKAAQRALPPREKRPGSLVSRAKRKTPARAVSETSVSKSSKADLSTTSSEEELEEEPSTAEAKDSDEQMALLVEDNDVNMKLLIALMKKLNLRYQCAVHGKEAYDRYRKRPAGYFLILMDISMPVMDGFTATSKIRAFEGKQRLPRTRIVALTGVTNQEAKRQAFDAGVDEYYAKPVRMKELKELVDRIQTQRAVQEERQG